MPDTLADDEFGFGSSGAVSAFFVVSVSGLTTNSTYGQIAQIGTPLYASAHHFSEAAPASVAWQWHHNTGEIAGATSAAYTPVPGDNLENIYPTATPLGPYASQAGPAYTVRFAAPVLAGVLPDVSYFQDSGDKTVTAASGFSGENLIYSIQTDIPGVAVETSTGIVTIPTVAEVNGAVTVTATNSGGAAQNTFEVEVVDDVVAGPPFTVDVGGLTDGIARIGTTVSAEIMWNIPAGEVLRYRWRSEGEVIPGARSRTYQVDEAYDGTDLSVTITTVEDGAKTTARYPVQYEAPEAAGTLAAVSYSVDSGEQTINAVSDFTGAGIIYSVDSPIAGVSIDSSTGIVTIPTEAATTGRITVTGINSGGSAQSAFDVSIANADTVPDAMSAPTVTAAGPTSLQIDLAAAPQDGGSPIISYDLHVSGGNGTPTIIQDISDPDVVTGLTPDTVYELRTRAVNAIGEAQWSPITSASTTAATAGLPEIVVNTGNTVDIMVGEGTFTVTVSGSDYAHHNGTHGPFTSSDLDTGPIAATAPLSSGSAGVGETLTALPGLWIHEAGDTPTITGKWHRNGVDIPGATGSTYVVTETDGGETITYVETATNVAGSRVRNGNGIVIPVATVPGQMAAPTVTAAGSDGIDVVLAVAPNDGGSAITSYDLRWQADGGAWTTAMGISNPHAVSGLTASTTHHVQTRAVNVIGHGTWSASGTATTVEAGAGTLFTDTFDYADGTLLTSRPEWSDQYTFGGAIEARSGNAQLVSGGGQWLKCGNALAADQFAEVVVTDTPAPGGESMRLYVRQTGTTRYYGIRCTAGSVSLVREGPSGYSALWIGPAAEAGDRVRVEAEGTTIRYVLNGIVAQTVTDSDVTDGAAAFLMSGSAKIGQFSCGEL